MAKYEIGFKNGDCVCVEIEDFTNLVKSIASNELDAKNSFDVCLTNKLMLNLNEVIFIVPSAK